MTFLYCWSWMTFPPSFRWKTTVRTLFSSPKLIGGSWGGLASVPRLLLVHPYLALFFSFSNESKSMTVEIRTQQEAHWLRTGPLSSPTWNQSSSGMKTSFCTSVKKKKNPGPIVSRSEEAIIVLNAAGYVVLLLFFSSSPCRNKHKEAYHLSRWRSKTDNFFSSLSFFFWQQERELS